jgi:hypothetical protein
MSHWLSEWMTDSLSEFRCGQVILLALSFHIIGCFSQTPSTTVITWCSCVHVCELLYHQSNPTGLHCKVCNSRCLLQSRITEPWPPSFQFHTLVVSVVPGSSRYRVHNVTYRLCSSHCCIPHITALHNNYDTHSFLIYRTDAVLTILYVHTYTVHYVR